jgi:hypothetical protein
MGVWTEFVKTLQFRVELGTEPLPKPKPEDLDAYEAKAGLRLPESYLGFILAAGAGVLCGAFEIQFARLPREEAGKHRGVERSLSGITDVRRTASILQRSGASPAAPHLLLHRIRQLHLWSGRVGEMQKATPAVPRKLK